MENMMTATVKVPEVTPAIMEQKLTREVSEIEFKAESYVIQNDEDYAAAGEFGKMLKEKCSPPVPCYIGCPEAILAGQVHDGSQSQRCRLSH